jgi:hypothetical protein
LCFVSFRPTLRFPDSFISVPRMASMSFHIAMYISHILRGDSICNNRYHDALSRFAWRGPANTSYV